VIIVSEFRVVSPGGGASAENIGSRDLGFIVSGSGLLLLKHVSPKAIPTRQVMSTHLNLPLPRVLVILPQLPCYCRQVFAATALPREHERIVLDHLQFRDDKGLGFTV
jgi:hypothetical protein